MIPVLGLKRMVFVLGLKGSIVFRYESFRIESPITLIPEVLMSSPSVELLPRKPQYCPGPSISPVWFLCI